MAEPQGTASTDGIGSIADDAGLNLPIFLADTWVFWYDDSSLKSNHSSEYDINVKILGEFSTIQGFWGMWRHLNTLELLPDYSNIRLFRKGILPMWEDPANVDGGKWILPTATKEEAVRLWPLLVLMCIGEQFESELDVTGMVLSLTSPSFTPHGATPPPPASHTPTFQVWTRSGSGPSSLLSSPSSPSTFSSASPSPSPSPVPTPVPSVFYQKLLIPNHVSVVYQLHLMSVDFVRNFVKRVAKQKKKKGGKRGGNDEDEESEDSRANTPISTSSEDYHFIPISSSGSFNRYVGVSPSSSPTSSPSASPSSSPSPSPSYMSQSPRHPPPSPSFPSTYSSFSRTESPRPNSPYSSHHTSPSPLLHPPSPHHYHPPSHHPHPPPHRHSPPPLHGPPHHTSSTHLRQSPPSFYHPSFSSSASSPSSSFSSSHSTHPPQQQQQQQHFGVHVHPPSPSPPPFHPSATPGSASNPPSPTKNSKTPPPFVQQRSTSARTLTFNEPSSSNTPHSPPRSFSKLTRSASPQFFANNSVSFTSPSPTANLLNPPSNPSTMTGSSPDFHSGGGGGGGYGGYGGGGGSARPPSRGASTTPTNQGARPPSRSSSTSPSFFSRKVQQTKKDELLKKISHSTPSQIEVQEMRHNPLLLQLVSFTNKKKASDTGKTITPTPTRSRSASRSSSPQPTPPTSPKVSSHLISSPSSAFAIKKSQEITPPTSTSTYSPLLPLEPLDPGAPVVVSAFSRKPPPQMEPLIMDDVVVSSTTTTTTTAGGTFNPISSRSGPSDSFSASGSDFVPIITEKSSTTKGKELEKRGSKLKLSLHASSQEETDGDALDLEEELSKMQMPTDNKEQASKPTALRQSLRHTQEIPIVTPSGTLRVPALHDDLDEPIADDIEIPNSK